MNILMSSQKFKSKIPHIKSARFQEPLNSTLFSKFPGKMQVIKSDFNKSMDQTDLFSV